MDAIILVLYINFLVRDGPDRRERVMRLYDSFFYSDFSSQEQMVRAAAKFWKKYSGGTELQPEHSNG